MTILACAWRDAGSNSSRCYWIQYATIACHPASSGMWHKGTPRAFAELLHSFTVPHVGLKLLMTNFNWSCPAKVSENPVLWKDWMQLQVHLREFCNWKRQMPHGTMGLAKQIHEDNGTSVCIIFFRNKGRKMGL